jgi:hypothetical protein
MISYIVIAREGETAGEWFWCFNAFGRDINWPRYPAVGIEPTKQGAADRVRQVFERCLLAP